MLSNCEPKTRRDAPARYNRVRSWIVTTTMRWASRRRITAALLLAPHAPRATAYVQLPRTLAAAACAAGRRTGTTNARCASVSSASTAETSKAIPTANTDLSEGRTHRYRATVMYDGLGFKGFQVQPEPQRTVQVS
jgi:hypothetical protein